MNGINFIPVSIFLKLIFEFKFRYESETVNIQYCCCSPGQVPLEQFFIGEPELGLPLRLNVDADDHLQQMLSDSFA
jgi:hypothetical protein